MATGGEISVKLKLDSKQFSREMRRARKAVLACPCWWCRATGYVRRLFAPRVEETPEQKLYRNTSYGRHDFTYRPDDPEGRR